MNKRTLRSLALGLGVLTALVLLTFASVPGTQAAPGRPTSQRYILAAKSVGEYSALKAEAVQSGLKVEKELAQVGAMVVTYTGAGTPSVATSAHARGMAPDMVRPLVRPSMAEELMGITGVHAPRQGTQIPASKLPPPLAAGDPAFSLPGLMWNVLRVRADQAWNLTGGSAAVTVGVSDTGLDFTHKELQGKISKVVDLTDKTLCKTYFTPSMSDADWAAKYGGPATTDWNGHGTWIGGNIAGALNGKGINGIAPKVNLVALKISEWCGSAFDSSIVDSFLYAADHNIDIVSISFGGYLDRSDPQQELIYQVYLDVVQYAWSKGTVIVSSSGNDHLQMGAGGLVTSHGILTLPGDPLSDYYGLYENPAGIPGVVAVSATGNYVAAPSATCPTGTTGASATCKPLSDPHQPYGVGKKNQLTYYSNYGPRIDLAAPGGARKFNVPNADRGGTSGFPETSADGFTVFEDFSITSDWALQIPCYYFTSGEPYFWNNECYSAIQGTSMATPHVSAVMALVASRNPLARHNPALLVYLTKRGAAKITGNTTPALSATDTTGGDRVGGTCPNGYCHFGGPAISDKEAYGAGLVDAWGALTAGR